MGKARDADQTSHGQSKRAGETTDDQKPTKRTRVSRACDQCRASREKCDGSQPVCQSCVSQYRECTYNEAPKKRGIQPNYIRTLELVLAYILEQWPDAQRELCNNLPIDHSHLHRVLADKDSDDAERLHQAWRSSLLGRQIEQVLSGTEVEQISPAEHIPSQLIPQQPESEPALREPQLLRLPQNAWTLFEYYSAYIHSWMPMTEKAMIMKVMYGYPSDGIPLANAIQAEHAELWSIMAVATHFIQLHGNEDEAETLRVRRIAGKLIPTGNTYEIPHLKALILLTLIDMSEGRSLDGWLRIGTVVRVLRLFTLLEENGTSRWCRHVHHAAFLVEASLALRMKTQGHLTPEYIERIGLIPEDGRDEWDPWRDPLAVNEDMHRAPARSFSTLNQLISMHVGMVSEGRGQPSGPDDTANSSIIFGLLANASSSSGRLQPAVFLEQHRMDKAGSSTNKVDLAPVETPQAWPTSSRPLPTQPSAREFADIDLPSEFTEIPSSVVGLTASDGPALTEEGDIFQELAMLERADSSNQFMQNLGFGPDHDLLEFFGDMYQASDSMLQPGPPLNQFEEQGNT